MSKIKSCILFSLLLFFTFILIGCYSVNEIEYISFESQPGTIFNLNDEFSCTIIVKLTDKEEEKVQLKFSKTGELIGDSYPGFQLTGFDTTKLGNRTATISYVYKNSSAKLFIDYQVVKDEVELDFAGGTGTENDPYIIANRTHMQNISKHYDDAEPSYYKVAEHVKTIDASDWVSVNLYGSFDGNGVNFNNLNNYLFMNTKNKDNKFCVLKNFTVNANIVGGSHQAAVVENAYSDTKFENITVHGYIEGGICASFLGFGAGQIPTYSQQLTFLNCYSDAKLVAVAEGAGGFIVHPFNNSKTTGSTAKIQLINSKFVGSMVTVGYAKYICGNTGGYERTLVEESFTDGSDSAGLYDTTKTGNVLKIDTPYAKDGCVQELQKSELTLPGLGSVFTVDQETGATYAIATLNIGPNDKNDTGNFVGTYLTERLEPVAGKFTTETIKFYEITINGTATEETGVKDNVFNIVHPYYGKTYGSAIVRIVQYDAQGIVLRIDSVSIKPTS